VLAVIRCNGCETQARVRRALAVIRCNGCETQARVRAFAARWSFGVTAVRLKRAFRAVAARWRCARLMARTSGGEPEVQLAHGPRQVVELFEK